jgi:hypothetical protein
VVAAKQVARVVRVVVLVVKEVAVKVEARARAAAPEIAPSPEAPYGQSLPLQWYIHIGLSWDSGANL